MHLANRGARLLYSAFRPCHARDKGRKRGEMERRRQQRERGGERERKALITGEMGFILLAYVNFLLQFLDRLRL